MSWLSDPSAWSALVALLVLEIVLGVDNVISSRFWQPNCLQISKIGLARSVCLQREECVFAAVQRWVDHLVEDELLGFTLLSRDFSFSGKELILLAGGVFLIYKATKEIHHKLEGEDDAHGSKAVLTFGAVIAQVMLLDVVFSLDSVFTAVGMTEYIPVMVISIVTAVIIMLAARARFIPSSTATHR